MTEAIARVKRAAKRRSAAEIEWRAAIVAAAAEKVPLRRIGEAAGVSHVRVLKITRGE